MNNLRGWLIRNTGTTHPFTDQSAPNRVGGILSDLFITSDEKPNMKQRRSGTFLNVRSASDFDGIPGIAIDSNSTKHMSSDRGLSEDSNMKKAGVLILLALLSIMILPMAAQRVSSHELGSRHLVAHGSDHHEAGGVGDNETQGQNHNVQSQENDTGFHGEVQAHENDTDSHEEEQTHENDTGTVHEDQGHQGENETGEVHQEHNETGEVHQEPNVIRFSANVGLTGAQQSPPVVTEAFGKAQVRLVNNGTALQFRVKGCNIENVTAAHIHVNTTMANGPVVLFLYHPQTPLLSVEGCAVLSSGLLTGANLTAQPSVGVNTWDDFVNALLAGKAYVNVHTTLNPGGEIRG